MLNLRKKRDYIDYILITLEVLAVLGWTWFIASFIDVVAHNLDPNPIYEAWNLFEIFW